jgi:hypothetical protein
MRPKKSDRLAGIVFGSFVADSLALGLTGFTIRTNCDVPSWRLLLRYPDDLEIFPTAFGTEIVRAMSHTAIPGSFLGAQTRTQCTRICAPRAFDVKKPIVKVTA